MKKIVFTVTNDLTYDRRMIRIGESLARAGYEVTLVGRLLENSQPFDNQWIKPVRLKLFFNKGKFFYLEYNLRLFLWLLTKRFDVVCGIDLDSILACYFSVKIQKILRGSKRAIFFQKSKIQNPKSKINLVYDAHELFTETPEVVRRPLIRRIWLAVERFVVPKVDARYTVSQSVGEEFERRYGLLFGIIRNVPFFQKKDLNHYKSTSYEHFTEGVTESHPLSKVAKIILYQGALNEGRGIETAIEAMQFIEGAELWLIGEGDLSAILRGQVATLNLSEKVKFLGFIVPEKLPEFTAKADIGIHISEDKGLSYRYSLANKFFDYIQSGVPQIFTQFPEYQRFNAEYEIGLSIEKTDVQLFVSAIKQLLDNPDFYQKLKINCQKAAAELCWENEEKRLIKLYNSFFY